MLMQDDRIVLSSAHNGAEIRLCESSEELEWIRSILPDDVRLTSWTEEEMAAMSVRPVPVVQQSIDDVCLPAEEGGPDLNAIAARYRGVLRMVSKAVLNDIPAARARFLRGRDQ